MHIFPMVVSESVELTPEISKTFEMYKERLSVEAPNQLRIEDYQRLSFVHGAIKARRKSFTLLDVGVGAGQFVNSMCLDSAATTVTGMDLYPNKNFLKFNDRLTTKYQDIVTYKPDRTYDVVTCMECIEHLKDAEVGLAVENLRAACTGLLVVSVPFNEQKLPTYHLQRFTPDRLVQMFPKAEIYVMSWRASVFWAFMFEPRN
jgi:2-polyprenyl-3-methyl-5-hydroxy-6-metoxy-1,4-benzoquinol methylase